MTTPHATTGEARQGLSPQRAFVVQFYDSPHAGQPPKAGRVEHMTSGTVAHFQSWSELADFIALTAR